MLRIKRLGVYRLETKQELLTLSAMLAAIQIKDMPVFGAVRSLNVGTD